VMGDGQVPRARETSSITVFFYTICFTRQSHYLFSMLNHKRSDIKSTII
jgi:hypothetical protein